MVLTWGDVGVILAVLVMVGFTAGFIETWWEQRKRDKEKGGEL
ncbi:hypothetical protein ES703_20001 [subsurface metagenome]